MLLMLQAQFFIPAPVGFLSGLHTEKSNGTQFLSAFKRKKEC